MTRQVEVDVKAAQRIGTQHSVKWPREHARHIDRSNAHPAPRYRHSADGKAAQLHLAGLQGAANPSYLPLEFDTRALRADPLGYGGASRSSLRRRCRGPASPASHWQIR